MESVTPKHAPVPTVKRVILVSMPLGGHLLEYALTHRLLTILGYTDLACSYGRTYPNTLKLYCIKVFLWKKLPLHVRWSFLSDWISLFYNLSEHIYIETIEQQ